MSTEVIKVSALKKAIEKSWSKKTAYKGTWIEEKKSHGQCAVTALLVQNYLQGDIYKADVKDEKYSHFWNVLPNGEILDLTKSQFGNKNIKLINIRKQSVTELIKDKDLKYRYEILRKRVEGFLK
jgi:parvulin-like peptidyl-prolyl isomerase